MHVVRELFICKMTANRFRNAKADMMADSGGEIVPSDEEVLQYLRDLINTEREQFYAALQSALCIEPLILLSFNPSDSESVRSCYYPKILSLVANDCLTIETLDDFKALSQSGEFEYVSAALASGHRRVNVLITGDNMYVLYRPAVLRSTTSSTLKPFQLEKYL